MTEFNEDEVKTIKYAIGGDGISTGSGWGCCGASSFWRDLPFGMDFELSDKPCEKQEPTLWREGWRYLISQDTVQLGELWLNLRMIHGMPEGQRASGFDHNYRDPLHHYERPIKGPSFRSCGVANVAHYLHYGYIPYGGYGGEKKKKIEGTQVAEIIKRWIPQAEGYISFIYSSSDTFRPLKNSFDNVVKTLELDNRLVYHSPKWANRFHDSPDESPEDYLNLAVFKVGAV